jgi:transcriptional regulator with XRE-family HTH domain
MGAAIMNGTTLKALRLALGYTQPESASMIGGVALRTWKYWEAGDNPVPIDVENKMYELFDYKQDVIKSHSKSIRYYQAAGLPYRLRSELLQLDKIKCKPYCMAMGELAGMFKCIILEAQNLLL